MQGCKSQQNPITSTIQECNKSCKTCTTLADIINIILCKHNINLFIHELATCSQSQISAMTSRQSVTCHRNRAERWCYCCAQLESIEVKKYCIQYAGVRQLTDREIKHFIELWRQQGSAYGKLLTLIKTRPTYRKTAMLNISKQMGEIDTGKDTLHIWKLLVCLDGVSGGYQVVFPVYGKV